MASHPLDNPIWHALGGPHAGFGTTDGIVARYLPEFAPFGAVGSPEDLPALTAFVPSGAVVITFTPAPFDAPPGLAILGGGTGNQMVVEAVIFF